MVIMVLLTIVRFIVDIHFKYYKSLPPITKAYGTLCLLATTVCQIGLFDTRDIALVYKRVFTHFQVCLSSLWPSYLNQHILLTGSALLS